MQCQKMFFSLPVIYLHFSQVLTFFCEINELGSKLGLKGPNSGVGRLNWILNHILRVWFIPISNFYNIFLKLFTKGILYFFLLFWVEIGQILPNIHLKGQNRLQKGLKHTKIPSSTFWHFIIILYNFFIHIGGPPPSRLTTSADPPPPLSAKCGENYVFLFFLP